MLASPNNVEQALLKKIRYLSLTELMVQAFPNDEEWMLQVIICYFVGDLPKLFECV